MHRLALAPALLPAAVLLAGPLHAQDAPAPRRTRVILGAQVGPTYPGADRVSLAPLFNLARARAGETFAYSASDQGSGFSLTRDHRFQIGPSFNFVGPRRPHDVGAAVPRVGTTIELGGFAQYQLTPAVRLRAELRQGIGGHRGLIGKLAADYVWRDGDRWLLSLGPRLTLVDGRYRRAYFGITPATAAATGLPVFAPDGGVEAVGATAGALRQLSRRWGVYGYAHYDRLTGDAAQSPLTRRYGDRNQLSGGLALSYTFGG